MTFKRKVSKSTTLRSNRKAIDQYGYQTVILKMQPKKPTRSRARVMKTAERLRREQNEQNKDRIAALEKALEKKDHELDTAVDGMDLDPIEEDNADPSNDGNDTSPVKKEEEDGGGPIKEIKGVEAKRNNEQKGDEEMGGKKEKQNKQKKDEEGTESADEGKGDAKKKKDKRKKKKVAIASVGEDSDSEGSGLFVPDSSDGSDSESHADSAAFSDEEYGKPLFSFPGIQPSDDATTVGWTSGRSTQFINMHGKKSRARYRLETSAYPLQYEDKLPPSENVSHPKNRYGDMRLDNGKHKYTKRHVLQIFGVAYKSTGTTVSSRDVESIRPKEGRSWRTTPTYVLIAWQVSDEVVDKSWEPRSCLRRIYGTEKADDIIYQAAVKAEDRYEEAKTGRKKAYSRSPSRGLADEDVERERQKSLDGLRSPTPVTRGIKSKSPRAHSPDADELREGFLADYCELVGVESFSELSRDDKRDCLAAWKAEKAAAGV
jgi:hypothetical protein